MTQKASYCQWLEGVFIPGIVISASSIVNEAFDFWVELLFRNIFSDRKVYTSRWVFDGYDSLLEATSTHEVDTDSVEIMTE